MKHLQYSHSQCSNKLFMKVSYCSTVTVKPVSAARAYICSQACSEKLFVVFCRQLELGGWVSPDGGCYIHRFHCTQLWDEQVHEDNTYGDTNLKYNCFFDVIQDHTPATEVHMHPCKCALLLFPHQKPSNLTHTYNVIS